jgi:uncharacterized membrane protein
VSDKERKNPLKRVEWFLRRHFLTGILVITPAAIAAWVLLRLLSWLDTLLWDDIRFGWIRPGGIPGVGLVTVLLLILVVGLLVNNYVGRRLYGIYDRLLTRIPLFNKIYTAVKQIGEAVLSSDKTVFRAVGMIEYPRKGVWSLVFITEQPHEEILKIAGERLRSVFLPTTPNPTSGFFLMVPERELHPLRITVEEGLKMVMSGGAVVPGLAEAVVEPKRGTRRWWGGRRQEADATEGPDALPGSAEESEGATSDSGAAPDSGDPPR